MAEVAWLRRSLLDLHDITAHIADSDPDSADEMASRLRDAGESLNMFPNRGRPFRDGVRALATVPPFVIHYEVEDDTVFILTIRHGRRRPLKSLRRP